MNAPLLSLVSTPTLEIEGIEVVYGGAILAVESVSLRVGAGEIVALLGANGAGKSTTLKAISGLVVAERGRVSRGRVRWDGAEIVGVAPNRLAERGIVHVLEGRHVFPQLTVEENLRAGAFLRRPSAQRLADQLERVYRWFPRLRDKRRVLAGLTSGGEQQMIAIGRALLTEPRLVLLDEPSMGLAPLIVAEIFEIIAELNRAEGLSFLVAEQNIAQSLGRAHRAYVLDAGRVALEGTAAELRARDDLDRIYLGAQV